MTYALDPLRWSPAAVAAMQAELRFGFMDPVIGAVKIEAEQSYPDGRYDILVRGIARVQLVEELKVEKPFREFRAEVLVDRLPAAGAASLSNELEALGQLILDLVGVLGARRNRPARHGGRRRDRL